VFIEMKRLHEGRAAHARSRDRAGSLIIGDVRRAFFGRLPRPLRWLWLAVLVGVVLECATVALGLVVGGDWSSAVLQLSWALAGPLLLGLLVAVAASRFVLRRAQPPAEGRRPADPEPRRTEQPRTEPSSSAASPEEAVGRRAGEAVAAMARSAEGRAAIRQTARLVRSIRAAASPPPASPAEPERRSGGEP
jgi:type VI protein secretion system component VasK